LNTIVFDLEQYVELLKIEEKYEKYKTNYSYLLINFTTLRNTDQQKPPLRRSKITKQPQKATQRSQKRLLIQKIDAKANQQKAEKPKITISLNHKNLLVLKDTWH